MLGGMRLRIPFLATLLVATVLFLPPCPASGDTIDQSFTSPTNVFLAMLTGQYIGQTYTAGITGTLTGVNLDIDFCTPGEGCFPISDTSFPMQVAIYDTENGLPTTVLGSTTLPAGQPAPPSLLISFPQIIEEIAGEQHAVVVNFPGSTPGVCCPFPNNGIWLGSASNSYTAGAHVVSFDGLSWFVAGPIDLHFQTHVQAVPEPGTLLLLTTGVLGVVGSVWQRKRVG